MTTAHLSSDEVVAALDGELQGARAHHVDSCASCREAVESAHAVLRELSTVDVPEPSPLFWDHFSARVRKEAAAGSAHPAMGWPSGWRLWVAVGSAAAVAFLVVTLRSPLPVLPAGGNSAAAVPAPVPMTASVSSSAPTPQTRAVVPDSSVTTRSIETPASDTQAWPEVVQMASALSSDDVHSLAPGGETSLLVEALSARERAAFVRLLTEEMEKTQ